ncbi:hypothetical protein BCR43DRAFT_481468 [Syncephalastrum racemosum]|uniref:Uncharacterized protein n=1 Tax=Syncephalastrum racemosum TaxID=13706 RepID=A0A1X2HS31_SYNRA|nr:hypothetical protein BCR43DRAFT_481468 [Syncephalastrum racemosum]
MDVWRQLCLSAFDGTDVQASNLLLNLDSHCTQDGNEVHIQLPIGTGAEQKHTLHLLGFHETKRNSPPSTIAATTATFAMSLEQWQKYQTAKRQYRRDWHQARQEQLGRELQEALTTIPTLTVELEQRCALLAEHSNSAALLPLFRGITGFIQHQLYHSHLSCWSLPEDIILQSGLVFECIRVLRGIFGFNLHYDTSEAVLVCRMNEHLSDKDLRCLSRLLPSEPSSIATAFHYTKTTRDPSLVFRRSMLYRFLYIFVHRIRALVSRCISLLSFA